MASVSTTHSAVRVSTEKKKKKTQPESCELRFVWGQNEDYSPGDSLSDSSEKLLQRGKGEGQSVLYLILVKRVHAVKHRFWQKIVASQKEQMSLLMILVIL